MVNMATTDHYKVLGVSQDCSEDDLKKAYRSLAKQYHPDKNKDAGAEEKFKEIGGAYETLKDSESRRTYDLQRETEELRSRREKDKKKTSGGNSSGGTSFTFTTPSGTGNTFSFSQNGSNFTFKTSFTSSGEKKKADEEKKEKKKKQPKSKSNYKMPFEFSRPEWNSHFAEESASEEDLPGLFNFNKNIFRDSFQQMDTVFDEFFRDPFFEMGVQGMYGVSVKRGGVEKVKQKPKKKDKDPMGDMYDWSKPVFPGKRSHFEDEDYDLSYESDEDISKYLFPCSFCERKFHSADLHKHEETCRRIYNGRTKPGASFKPDKQKAKFREAEDSDVEDYEEPTPRRSHDWRQEHEELKANVRQAKRAAARTKKEAKIDLVTCDGCGLSFDEDVAERHIPFCKKVPQDRGEPVRSKASNVHSRDYGSKNYHAKEYAKNVPKPKPSKTSTKGSKTSRDNADDSHAYMGDTGRSNARSTSAGTQKTSSARTNGTSDYSHFRTTRKK